MPTYRIQTTHGAFDVTVDREVTEDQLFSLVQEQLAQGAGGEKGGAGDGGGEEGPGLLRRGAAFAVRVGAPIVGAAGGLVAGGPLGAAAGAGLAGAAGEAIAQKIAGEETDPLEIGLAGALSALPAGPFARAAGKGALTFGKQVALHTAEGATQGALAETARSLAKEGDLPELSNVVTTAAGGSVLGGAFGVAAGRQARKYDRAVSTQVRKAIFSGAEEAQLGASQPSPAVRPDAGQPSPAVRPVQLELFENPPPPGAIPERLPGEAKRPFTRTPGVADEIPEASPMPKQRIDELADEYVDRVFADMPPPARQELADVYKAVPELVETQTRGHQSISRTKALAREISLDPDDILPPGTAANAEQIAATTNLVSTLHDRIRRLRDQLASDPDNVGLQEALRKEHARFVRTSLTLAGLRSEAGRALRIQQEVMGEISPGALSARFSAQARKFGADVDTIIAALDRAGDDPVKQYRELLNIARSDWRTKAHSYYVLNLLTNPKTMERNFFGNFTRAIEDPILRPFAGGIDAITSKVTGKERQVFAGEAWQMILGAKKSLPDAWNAFFQIMKRGYTDRQAIEQMTKGKFDVRPEPFAGGIWNPYNLISRLLNATDQFFWSLNVGMQRDALAFAKATKMARKELADGIIQRNELRERIAILAADLSRQYADSAPKEIIQQAERSIYREDNVFAKWLAGVDQLPLPMRATFRFLVPFVGIPANIIKQGIEHTPAGFLMRGARAGDRNARFRQTEAALGILIVGGGAWAALNGFLAPKAPSDPGKREAFFAKFPIPSAAYIPGLGWISYNELGHLGIALGIVADSIYGWQEADITPDAGAIDALLGQTMNALHAAGSGLFERGFLTGMADFFEVLRGKDPRALSKFIENRAVSIVPFQGLGRALTQVEDDLVRDSRSIGEKIQSIVPPSIGNTLGIPDSADLPARLDAFGRPIKRPISGAKSLLTFIGADPRTPDPVRIELEKYGIEPEPAKPIKELKLGSTTVRLSRQQEHALRQAKGQLRYAFLTNAIASPAYQKGNEVMQERILRWQLSRNQGKLMERARFLLRSNREFTVDALLRGIIPPIKETERGN